MAESQARIVIDADAARVIAEAVKAQKAVKGIGDASKGVGDEIGKWGGQLAKSVAGVGAIVRAIAAVSQEVNKAQRAAADANRKAGGEALDRGITAARLGISAGDADALTKGGARSATEVDSLLAALLSAKEGKDGARIDRTAVFKAAGLYQQGVFSQDELVKAASSGGLDALLNNAGARRAAVGSDAEQEAAIRAYENAAAAEALRLRAARGLGARTGQAAIDVRNARHPGAAALQGVAGGFTSVVGGDAIVEASDTAINANTAELRSLNAALRPRPALAPGVE